MFTISSIILLSAASSHLLERALAQAVVFPYNCASKTPICQTDCQTAVTNICSGKVGPMSQEQITTVNGCTAKYTPVNGVADYQKICLANFQKILDISNPAAAICDGKTLPQIGGVLHFDADNKVVPGSSYAIFPASNNPNCIVNPSQIKAVVPAQYSLNGKIYNPALCAPPSTGSISTRGAALCGGAIAAAAVCGSSCAVGVAATLLSWGIAAPIAWASCFLCIGPATWGVFGGCINDKRDILGRPVYMPRAARPEMCSGSELNPSSLTIIPSCLKDALTNTCATLNWATS